MDMQMCEIRHKFNFCRSTKLPNNKKEIFKSFQQGNYFKYNSSRLVQLALRNQNRGNFKRD